MASRQNEKTRIVLQHSRKAFRSPAGPDLLLVVFSGRLCDGVPDWQGTAMRVHLCGTLARGGLGHEARAGSLPSHSLGLSFGLAAHCYPTPMNHPFYASSVSSARWRCWSLPELQAFMRQSTPWRRPDTERALSAGQCACLFSRGEPERQGSVVMRADAPEGAHT